MGKKKNKYYRAEEHSGTDDPSGNEDRKKWLESSQDLYIIRSEKDDIGYLPWEGYRNAPLIEWFNTEEDCHFCILTENGYQPENLTGPAITKVIPWNLTSARLPGNYQGTPLQPGYLIDLRILHMSRLLNPAFQIPMNYPTLPPLNDILRDKGIQQPITKAGGQRPDDAYIPVDKRYELANIPYDNLYIVSWKDPLGEHSIDEYDPYQINYIPASVLDECVPAQEVSTGDTMVVLESYFKAAGSQTGALNPKDWEYVSLHGSCYVANLSSFK